MRFRSTLLLLVLAAAVGGYVYLVEFQKAADEAKKKTLFEFDPETVTDVTLTYPDRTLTLHKSDQGWRLTAPVDSPADEAATKNLISAIAQCEVKKEVENPSTDRAIYGLEEPFVTVKVKLKDRELPAFQIGKNAPIGFSTYVSRVDDQKILLAPSTLRSGMDRQAKDLRDKAILQIDEEKIRQIAIRGPTQNILLSKKDDTWVIEKPAPYAADPATVRTYLSTLRALRAVDFASDDPQDLNAYGLVVPRLAVSLYTEQTEDPPTILFGGENEKKEVFAKTTQHPTVYTVGDWALRELSKQLNDFRDKTVVAFDKEAARQIEIARRDGSTVTLTRGDDKKWQVNPASDAGLNESAITQYLTDLHDLKGSDIVADHTPDLNALGFEPPVLTISLFGAGTAKLGSVVVGQRDLPDNKKEYTAKSADAATVFTIRDYTFTRLNKEQKDFLPLPPTPTGAVAAPADGDGDAGDGELLDEALPNE